MLLCKRFHSFRSHFGHKCRLYSSKHGNSPYPFRNLRAVPFNVSPYDAQRYLGPFAALLRREKLFPSLVARILPGMGFEPIKPYRLTPVWFPAWILDVEVKGEVDHKGNEYQAFSQIHNAYVPGSDYKVLSSAPLGPFDNPSPETVPFTDDLLRQYDLDVACIPYNISPFSILEIARHLSLPEATIAQDFRFSPSTLQPTLFAAYPVLVPIYLAQYEYNTESGTGYHTLIFEAHGSFGNIWSEPFSPDRAFEDKIFQYFRQFASEPINPDPNAPINFGYPKRFIDTAGFSHTPHQELERAIRDYLESALNLPSTPTALAAASVNGIDNLAEDARVREYTIEDRTPVVEWMKLGAELMMVQRIHEAMSDARSGGNFSVHTGTKGVDKMTFVNGAIRHLADKAKVLKIERMQLKPTWAKSEEDLREEQEAKAEAENSAQSQTEKDSDSS